MSSSSSRIRKSLSLPFLVGICTLTFGLGATAEAQVVRGKRPDRGVYKPPQLEPVVLEEIDRPIAKATSPQRGRVSQVSASQLRPLVDVSVDEPNTEQDRQPLKTSGLRPVGHNEVVLLPPSMVPVRQMTTTQQGDVWVENDQSWHEGEVWDHGEVIHDETCDGCDTCDSMGPMGCDSMGGSSHWANSSLSFDRNRWFGGLELLLMFRRGDRPPALVTTGPDGDADTAGELGQAGTSVLVGRDSILKDMTAGGRLTLGTWLDDQCCRSMVLRGWFAGEESFGFQANQNSNTVLARPFLNVSDNQTPGQDTQLITFPNRANGSIDVRASSDVFGGDLSIRQLLYGKYGGSVDVMYGYQYMRLDENLSISSTSTSLDDDFAPLGSVISISDAFETENEFHGAQLGVASRYREGCWSFNALAKVGFGSLRRRAKLSGNTFTSIDGANATDPQGLLVRDSNSGTSTDHTFGWVPEIDLSIGWQRFPQFDVTLGYHVIAMTDALQTSNTIDPNLAVNLSDPPTGQQSPVAAFSYDTFYVQGIHFGIQYIH
ncbi:MAG: BBP7 family outer membrane beta-barrel protein [Rubripirellula sp.]